MYSQDDLNGAVAAGVISADAASALRAHVAASREQVTADAEHFRLITGFNDIFVSIGVVIMLLAVGAIGQALAGVFVQIGEWPGADASATAINAYYDRTQLAQGLAASLAGAAVAATAWLLAEFFTRRRRMALPSIILLIALLGGVMATQIGGILAFAADDIVDDRVGVLLLAFAGLVTAGFAWLHWRRFMVPITIAGGTAALTVTVVALLLAAIGESLAQPEDVILPLIFAAGVAIFAFAMRWDMSDTARTTRRSDVAFWLHLLAAPMIAHPVFAWIGVTEGDNVGIGAALAVIAVYFVFGLIALAVDRRALLVSALAYVLIALTYLFREFGAVELNFALTALVIGSALLTLSALWTPIRRTVVSALPVGLRAKLPATGDAIAVPAAA